MNEYEKAIGWYEKDNLFRSNKHFHDAAIAALRSQSARENPKPLTLDKLKERNGKPVFKVLISENIGEYIGCENAWWDVMVISKHSEDVINWRSGHLNYIHDYGKTWIAYDHEPKGEQ